LYIILSLNLIIELLITNLWFEPSEFI